MWKANNIKNYYLPDAAGVAFSRNLYRWAPQIRREDGFVRLVWGLGTRAVDRVGNDYPRLIALSHPLLRPTPDQRTMERCSQQFVDVIDLKENSFMTLPVHDVLDADYPALRYIAQVSDEGYFSSLRSRLMEKDRGKLVLTFEDLLRGSDFAARMRQILTTLERCYEYPVDLEFTLNIREGSGRQTGPAVHAACNAVRKAVWPKAKMSIFPATCLKKMCSCRRASWCRRA